LQNPERAKLENDKIALQLALKNLSDSIAIKEKTIQLKRSAMRVGNAVPNILDACRRKTGSALKSSLNGSFTMMDQYRLTRCHFIERSFKLGDRVRIGKYGTEQELKNVQTAFADLSFFGIELVRNFPNEVSETELTELIEDQAAAEESFQKWWKID
jgi:hypothetical protein